MKKLFWMLVVLAIFIVALGFYRGWFALSSPRDTESNKVNINLTVDPDKAKADAETVKDRTTELTGKVTKKAKELGDQARDKVKSARE
jgi:F0F1-type ATP synthase membrane subunit b/b'